MKDLSVTNNILSGMSRAQLHALDVMVTLIELHPEALPDSHLTRYEFPERSPNVLWQCFNALCQKAGSGR